MELLFDIWSVSKPVHIKPMMQYSEHGAEAGTVADVSPPVLLNDYNNSKVNNDCKFEKSMIACSASESPVRINHPPATHLKGLFCWLYFYFVTCYVEALSIQVILAEASKPFILLRLLDLLELLARKQISDISQGVRFLLLAPTRVSSAGALTQVTPDVPVLGPAALSKYPSG